MSHKFQQMIDLLQQFIEDPECWPFLEPVDWKALGLLDYPEIIEKPMDFSTIQVNIAEDLIYTSADMIADDIRLVFTNCMKYNAEGSDFYNLARKNSTKFESLLLQLRRRQAHALDTESISMEAKEEMNRLMCKLSNANRGRLVAHLETSLPSTVYRSSIEPEVLINLDTMTKEEMVNLKKFVIILHESKKRKQL